MRTEKHMRTGIYAIEHKATGRAYIGSAKDFDSRWRVHRCLLRQGKHHSPHLQAAWNKYSENAFIFKKLLVCSADNLIDYEQRLIDGYRCADRRHGFNARALAESSLGHKASPETRAKIKAARAKQVFSVETRAIWSKNRTGQKMPEGFGDKVRIWKLGSKHTEATKSLISLKGIGRQVSVASREKKSKLTASQVTEIQSRYQSGGITQTALAREFSLNQSTISLIVRGKRWCIPFHTGETTW